MATKDWKRYGNLWENAKKNKQLVIRNLSLHIYDVLIWHHNRLVDESEFFKTKSEALAFVKAYMRKH